METPEDLSNLSLLLPVICVVFIIAGGVIILNLHFHKNLFRQKLVQEELINSHQQELLRSSIQAQEEERKRIAANLHDELGAVLSIARMHLVALEERNRKSGGEYITALQDVRSLTETSISSMRRISHELMPQNLQMFGLGEALQNIAGMINKTNGIAIDIQVPESTKGLAWPLNLGLYRVCMELINNTIKHAQATAITIDVEHTRALLIFFYKDNGVGVPENYGKYGIGHKSIEARSLSMGGSLEAGNAAEGGYYARITIPQPAMKE